MIRTCLKRLLVTAGMRGWLPIDLVDTIIGRWLRHD